MHSILRFTLIASTTIAVSLTASAQSLASQSADSTTFRAGQWGSEFSLGGYNSLGVLRFSSPTRAWIGSLNGQFRSVDDDSNPPLAGGVTSSSAMNVQLGRRFYRPALPSVMQHLTLGALAGITRSEVELPSGSTTDNGGVGGLFADLGALWMVTRSLSLGAAWTLSATVTRTENSTSQFEQKRSVTNVSLGQVSIRGALYF